MIGSPVDARPAGAAVAVSRPSCGFSPATVSPEHAFPSTDRDKRASVHRVTLIIGAVCDRFVVLIADRRITTTNASGEVTDQEDLHTKTVFLDGRYIMGFAGLARLGPKNYRMEQWLVEDALKASGGADYFDLLADKTGKALEEAGYGVKKGSPRAHAF